MKTTLAKIVFSAALILLLALLLNCRDDKNPVAPSGFNFDPNQIPRFVRANYIDPTRMKRISKFRSAIGSDYSDDFEKCRNMKMLSNPGAIAIGRHWIFFHLSSEKLKKLSRGLADQKSASNRKNSLNLVSISSTSGCPTRWLSDSR